MIDKFVNKRNLFNGGCCYAAAQIARGLEQKGIKYSVVVFQDREALHCRNLKKACQSAGCAHVAILVNYKHKMMYIGDTSEVILGLNDAERYFGFPWVARRYNKVNWRDLEYCYYHNEWNPEYNPVNNRKLYKELNKIFAEN